MSEKAILFDTSRCSACRGCQVACKCWNELPSTIELNGNPRTGSYQSPADLNGTTRLIITFNEEEGGPRGEKWAFGRRSCQHCTDAPCATICPAGAIYQHEETGFVTVDDSKCIGCQYCSTACPFDVPHYSEGLRTTVNKCTACIDRIVAASSLAMAGSAPAAYLEDLADLLGDDGMTEDQARVGALVASLALRFQLEAPAQAVSRALGEAGCTEPHPLRCPVCGGAPSAARVGGQNSTQGRGKTLWCAQCGTTWEFDRVRCARCGTHNQGHLHYFNVEGDDAHRIATCEECGGYVRTTYADDALAPFSFEVEDVVMARLDAIAANPAFAGGDATRS